jgi:hypothetical protein
VSHPATYFWGDLGGEDSHLTVRNDEGKLNTFSLVLEKLVFFRLPLKLTPQKVAFAMKI